MKRLTPFAAVLALASPAVADALRPAPDYYVEALFSLTMAEALATSCSTVGMDLLAAGATTTELREKLSDDGFDADQAFAQMIDPAPALRDMQAAFLEKHPGLGEPSEEIVCAAAQIEIDEETSVGRYLFVASALE